MAKEQGSNDPTPPDDFEQREHEGRVTEQQQPPTQRGVRECEWVVQRPSPPARPYREQRCVGTQASPTIPLRSWRHWVKEIEEYIHKMRPRAAYTDDPRLKP